MTKSYVNCLTNVLRSVAINQRHKPRLLMEAGVSLSVDDYEVIDQQ